MSLKSVVLLFVFFSSSLSFATSYSQGNEICGDFEGAKANYEMDTENITYQYIYAYCLILKGEDNKGLILMHPLAGYYNHIPSAFFIARYIKSGGRIDQIGLIMDRYNIEKAIQAYFRVLFLIDLGPNYPHDPNHRRYEADMQVELNSTYSVPFLYLRKFWGGIAGLHSEHLLISPSYEGDKKDLNTYPEYSPYTIDSLNNVIEFAGRCINLPNQPHFKSEYYKLYQEACQVLKDTAATLLPMEMEKLTLLASDCGKDLPKCLEYKKLVDREVSLLKQNEVELRKIFKLNGITIEE